ncbi:MAG: hypothetical protein SPF89_03585 [Sphaerochaetaceae bacterium]|nr:hypothetical protein [Spirochaetales bacterium]MDY5499166.1 hypothetical protein [Sphaerochaetaceae bacterium]
MALRWGWYQQRIRSISAVECQDLNRDFFNLSIEVDGNWVSIPEVDDSQGIRSYTTEECGFLYFQASMTGYSFIDIEINDVQVAWDYCRSVFGKGSFDSRIASFIPAKTKVTARWGGQNVFNRIVRFLPLKIKVQK